MKPALYPRLVEPTTTRPENHDQIADHALIADRPRMRPRPVRVQTSPPAPVSPSGLFRRTTRRWRECAALPVLQRRLAARTGTIEDHGSEDRARIPADVATRASGAAPDAVADTKRGKLPTR